MTPTSTHVEDINRGLHKLMASCDKTIFLGEDILDPYGGAFKASKGLSTAFPARTIATPISESAIIGLGTGLAMGGYRPVVEIMFGDFITLCVDQLVNSAAKFPLMYAPNVPIPLTIRTPMGGRRGYGPTHSQCLEKILFGIPGLRLVSPSIWHSPGDLLVETVTSAELPTIFLEYKNLYPKLVGKHHCKITESMVSKDNHVKHVTNFESGAPDVVVVTYGGTSEVVDNVMAKLTQEEIRVSTFCPSNIGKCLNDEAMAAIKTCGKLIVQEESTEGFNWGSEVSAYVYGELYRDLHSPVVRLSSKSSVVPAARHLEEDVLTSEKDLEQSILRILS